MERLMKERTYKFIFSILIVCLSFSANGQTVDGKLYTIFNNYYQWIGGKFNNNLNIPKIAATNGRDTGGIRYNLADSLMYVWTGSQWRVVGAPVDTSSLSSRINERVKYSDTAAMLNPYLLKIDTFSLSNRINLKQNLITLTTTGTSGNATFNQSTGALNIPNYSTDTTSLSNRINERVKYSDTAAMLANYLDYVPTLQQVTTAGNSINKNTDEIYINFKDENGNTIGQINREGGPVKFRSGDETDGYIQLWWDGLNKRNASGNTYLSQVPDSSGTLTQRVKVNGTTYNTDANGVVDLGTISSDTTSLSNRINQRVKYTDTAAMLTPYLRKIDTTNAFLISVSQPNDSTLRFAKGSTQTDYTIRAAVAGSATRLTTTVYNNSGATIVKGAVVYINGRHSSNLPTIALAQGNTEANSYNTFALVETDIANGSSGIVIQAGNIGNLNLPTSTYTDGQILYLSPTVAGGYTTTKPLAPNHIVKLGTVTRAHPTLGSIQIKIENGWQLDELSDVQIAAVPNDSTILQFSRVDSLWKAVDPTTAMGNRFVKRTDSAAMLLPYLRKADTATMLAPYQRALLPYRAISATYNALTSDYVIHCTSGTFTINLPSAVGIQGEVFIIKNTGSGFVTIDPNGSQTIDGSTTYTMSQAESVQVISTGSNWITL